MYTNTTVFALQWPEQRQDTTISFTNSSVSVLFFNTDKWLLDVRMENRVYVAGVLTSCINIAAPRIFIHLALVPLLKQI